jgi:glycine cleavage system T protein
VRKRAEVVIVGAGIVGCSAAYELTRMGVRNVVVLDQGPLEDTGGSTFHAPGLVFHTNASRTLAGLARASTDLYRALDAPDRRAWREVGGIEVATTPERLAECHRRAAYAVANGFDAEVLSPAGVVERVPLIDPDAVLGGLFVPRDGLCKAGAACAVLREAAEAAGAEFHGMTRVGGVDVRGGRVRGVESAAGAVATGTVLVCAGIWGPELAAMCGVPIPLQPMQHLFAWTPPLAELAGAEEEAVHPIVRHQDRSMYFRQRFDGYGIGAYRHEPVAIDPHEFTRAEDGHTTAQSAFMPELFADARDATNSLMPVLRDVELVDPFNGHFSFSPDGYPVLGPSARVGGLWFAEGIWVTHAGGSGRAVAELMTRGHSEIDMRLAHPDRFWRHATTRSYVRARGRQQYREVYDVIHPLQQMEHPRGLRCTPYQQRFEEAGAVLVESAGWERAQWFASNEGLPDPPHVQRRDAWAARMWSPIVGREHHATRERAGIFDLTPFTKVEVAGPGAVAWLNRVCASQMDRPVGRIVYTTVLDARGGVVCDLTVTRLAEDRFLVVTGGGSGPRDVAWLRRQLPDGGGATLTDVTSAICTLGVWGPAARDLVGGLTDDDLAFPYLDSREIEIGPVAARALRISYAGELGWELYTATEHGRWLWDALIEAGRPLGAAPAGLGAFDSLRVEKGYRFAGVDMHTEYTAAEAGLAFTVDISKPDFVGRAAVLEERARGGPRRRLACVVLDDRDAAPLGYEPLLADGRAVGYVTSANFGYTVGASITYGYLPAELAVPGTRVSVRVFDRDHGGTVSEEPLYDPRGERLR